MESKNSFILYTDSRQMIDLLSNEQKGILLNALFIYADGESLPAMDELTNAVFMHMKLYLDRDFEKYSERVAKGRLCGKMGGRPKKTTNRPENKTKEILPNGFSENPKVLNLPNGFSENPKVLNLPNGFSETNPLNKNPDNDSDNDNDNESDNNIYSVSTPDPKPTKHKHGEYENVLLSDQELDKLKTEYPGTWQEWIEKLSRYMASTGKAYKNHLATIRNWARKEDTQKGTELNETGKTYFGI